MFNYSKLKTPNSKLAGQALLELAIFGSLVIMLLGVLVSYGLRFGFQQEAQQEAFREAYKGARAWGECPEDETCDKPSAVSYTVIKDRHIPNPSDIWGFGAVSTVSASEGGITASYNLAAAPETGEELPVMTLNFQAYENGNLINKEQSFRTAGLLDFKNIEEEAVEKYETIYGSIVSETEGECLEKIVNPNNGQEECIRSTKNIRVMDGAAGEIVDYAGAIRQCRQFINEHVCVYDCDKGKSKDSETDCQKVCNYTVEAPWYCEGYEVLSNSDNPRFTKYYFPYIQGPEGQGLFARSRTNKDKSMGLAPDYTQVTTVNNKLVRNEDASQISATDTVNWNTTTSRWVTYNQQALDDDGVSKKTVGLVKEERNTTVSQDKTVSRTVTK